MKKFIFPAIFFGINLLSCANEGAVSNTETSNNIPDGKSIFKKNCIICHGADGKLQLNGAKDLSKSFLSNEARIEQITNGKKLMTPFRGILTEKEIKSVAEYVKTLNPQLK